MKKIRWQIAQFFERHWWKGYLGKRDSAAYLLWKKSYWLNFLQQINLSKEDFKKSIIDIGCGPAGIFMLFKDKELTALDPLLASYENLEIFSQQQYPNVDFVVKSFEDFETQKQFHTIFCLNAINHFVDIDLSFKKLKDICAEGGQLIVSVDAHSFSFFRKLFAVLPLDILHPHQYKLEEYEAFLVKNGFIIEKKVMIKKDFFFNYWLLVGRKIEF